MICYRLSLNKKLKEEYTNLKPNLRSSKSCFSHLLQHVFSNQRWRFRYYDSSIFQSFNLTLGISFPLLNNCSRMSHSSFRRSSQTRDEANNRFVFLSVFFSTNLQQVLRLHLQFLQSSQSPMSRDQRRTFLKHL